MIGTDGKQVIINLRTEAFDIWLFIEMALN